MSNELHTIKCYIKYKPQHTDIPFYFPFKRLSQSPPRPIAYVEIQDWFFRKDF